VNRNPISASYPNGASRWFAPFITSHTSTETNMWSAEAMLPVAGVARALKFARENKEIDQ